MRRAVPVLFDRFDCREMFYLTVLYISDFTQTSMVVSKGFRGSTPFPSRVCGFHQVARITLASRDGMQRLWIFVGI